ncbi:hypothetical protein PtA15_3A820 [Puccinia triticina]|uniref:Uncharacterized protein n=1 Tax=Puccinia triticina TaxID=208348 RepID=A0ABY7CEF1_9BASI|nr:uncharacterized protein PtA15_3A820 [Puccinia triticina]WAQ83449.1 hypothetical protein PtA15_3A820 [Puccinia triticina]
MQGVRRLSKTLQQRGEGKHAGQAEDEEMLSVRLVHKRALTLLNDTVVPANLFLFNACGILWNPAQDIYPHHPGHANPASLNSLSSFILLRVS